MADGIRYEMEGAKELVFRLSLFGVKVKPEIRKAVTAGANPILKTARKNAPTGAGLTPAGKPRKHLKKTLTKKVKSYRGAVVAIIGPKAGEGFHANLVHGGTKPHLIRARKGRSLAISMEVDGGRNSLGQFAGKSTRQVIIGPTARHPGAKANPFLARAAQTQRGAAVREMTNKLKSRIEAIARSKV